MTDLYAAPHRSLQDQFDSRQLADALMAITVQPTLDDDAKAFIESRAFFFLSTVNPSGHPTVSHKGGAPGFVKVVDDTTLVFPSYDGNGMFLSMGNIAGNGKVGMLFIDFETPHRIRVHADAVVSDDDPMMSEYPGADLVVRATITETFQNCPRYITRQASSEPSRYVPDADGHAPLPGWEKIDMLQPVLPERSRSRVDAEGGTITIEEYGRMQAEGRG